MKKDGFLNAYYVVWNGVILYRYKTDSRKYIETCIILKYYGTKKIIDVL